MWNQFLGKSNNLGGGGIAPGGGAPAHPPAANVAASAPPPAEASSSVPFSSSNSGVAVGVGVGALVPLLSLPTTTSTPMAATAVNNNNNHNPSLEMAKHQMTEANNSNKVTTATTPNPNINTNTTSMNINTSIISSTRKKKKKSLNAILATRHGGRKVVLVRVKIGNRVLHSAPNSGAEDNDHNGGTIEGVEGMTATEGFQDGIERSVSGSTNKTDISNTSMMMDHQSPTSANANDPGFKLSATDGAADVHNNAEDPHHPRRGRSASVDETHPNQVRGDGNFSSQTSASSIANAPTGGTGEGGGAGGPGAPSADFEASLLLGIAGESASGTTSASGPLSEKDLIGKREPIDPTTLPTSMTSFLDMLTEDQRRVRHRHIPGVDGFRKLYKSEVKSDMSEARRIKRKIIKERDISNVALAAAAADVAMMEVEEEGKDHDEDETLADVAATTTTTAGEGALNSKREERHEEEEEKKKFPDRDAFLAPGKEVRAFASGGRLAGMIESNDFENAMGPGAVGSSSAAPNGNGIENGHGNNSTNNRANSLKSPGLVASTTTFSPPRPQESTALKTQHRLRRWEANPEEAEADLLNYRKTVSRTRVELHSAEKERERIERVASLVRGHFASHLGNYRKEMMALNEELQGVNGECLKSEAEYNGRSMSTRGGVRCMKDVLGTLKSLGEDIKGVGSGSVSSASAGNAPADWRTVGVGGVRRSESGPYRNNNKSELAGGWLLVGDAVLVGPNKEEGKVVYVNGPEEILSRKVNEESASSSLKKDGGDAMDVDSPEKKKKRAKDDNRTRPRTIIGVKMAKTGKVSEIAPEQLEFNTGKMPKLVHSDASLVERWGDMARTALAHGMDHDDSAMRDYVNASLVAKAKEEKMKDEDGGDKADVGGDGSDKNDDGSASPKCVAQYEDDRALLPFGSGAIAAPQDVSCYPSVIPLDALEERVRKVTYEVEGPRVIPKMSPAVREYEARQEEMNALKGKVLQLRNRLSRQKRLRSLNERSLGLGKGRAHKVEGLLLEMQMDLKNLKERLQDELNEIGIGDNSPMPAATDDNGENNKEADGNKEIGNVDDGAQKEKGHEKMEAQSDVSVVAAAEDVGKNESGGDLPDGKQPVPIHTKEGTEDASNVVKEGGVGSSENPTMAEFKKQEENATVNNLPVGAENNSMGIEETERESKRPRVDE